ncbi:glyoxylate/hydroxypyruvate reductase A-like isoform X2 [Cherax quadricarinatus]|uniref:glyoxylate/hydroxypyruvate reductase A-like isoform X2 n=1 Tax=Cherax quadricarinatus TaxID=27406 RepID=UPI00387EC1CD
METAGRTVYVMSVVPDLSLKLRNKLPDVQVIDVKRRETADFISGEDLTEDDFQVLQDAEVLLIDNDLLPQLKPRIPISRVVSKSFGQLMAEHVIGWIICHERSWLTSRQNQLKSEWKYAEVIRYRSLQDLTVGVLGMGIIGREVPKYLKAFNSTVHAYTRTAPSVADTCTAPSVAGTCTAPSVADTCIAPSVADTCTAPSVADTCTAPSVADTCTAPSVADTCTAPSVESKSNYVDKYWRSDELPLFLQQCDYIVSILPSTSETRGMLGSDILKNAKKNAVLINVGRGDVISEADIVKALDSGWISAAILDVVEKEPLSSESLLWTHPKCILTPHTAAVVVFRPEDIADAFSRNYQDFLQGNSISGTIDFSRGY